MMLQALLYWSGWAKLCCSNKQPPLLTVSKQQRSVCCSCYSSSSLAWQRVLFFTGIQACRLMLYGDVSSMVGQRERKLSSQTRNIYLWSYPVLFFNEILPHVITCAIKTILIALCEHNLIYPFHYFGCWVAFFNSHIIYIKCTSIVHTVGRNFYNPSKVQVHIQKNQINNNIFKEGVPGRKASFKLC